MGTVIVGIIVLAIAGGAAYSLHRDKKKTENRSAVGIAAVVADTAIKRKLKRKEA